MHRGHTFCLHFKLKNGHRYQFLLVRGRNGKYLLTLNGYTYYQHKMLRDGFRWSCTQMGSRSCRGFLHVTHEKLVVRAFTEHTHPPSNISLINAKKKRRANSARRIAEREALNPFALKIVEFYLRPSGRINLRLNNFTFYKHLKARSNAHRWSCTAYGSKWKCKAHLIITDRLEVLKANISHSHPPSMKKEMKLPLPQLNLTKKDSDTPNASNSNSEINTFYTSLTPFQNYLAAHSVFDHIRIIQLLSGKTQLLIDEYPFYKKRPCRGGTRWDCNKASCKVFRVLSNDFKLVSGRNEHNHSPMNMIIDTLGSVDEGVKACALEAAFHYTGPTKTPLLNLFVSYDFDFKCIVDWRGEICKNKPKIVKCERQLITLISGKRVYLHDGYTYYMRHNLSGAGASLITLTNGKKRIKYKKYTYANKGKSESDSYFCWMCTFENCSAYLLVSLELDIRKVVEKHNHDPPKYRKTAKGLYLLIDRHKENRLNN
ncbi:unnamed protein product [Chrysodeixis includens]|uniref:FLYWCH-type domain-containing protein n=1 Tax=Chrysodeixis includens TaxID=689277 RepID=A0A9P0BMX1_CHRIL|nr:unnamed protein product [Chrysodeixis includens]